MAIFSKDPSTLTTRCANSAAPMQNYSIPYWLCGRAEKGYLRRCNRKGRQRKFRCHPEQNHMIAGTARILGACGLDARTRDLQMVNARVVRY